MLLLVALTNSNVIKLRVRTFVFDNEPNLGMKTLLLFDFGGVLATIKKTSSSIDCGGRRTQLVVSYNMYLK